MGSVIDIARFVGDSLTNLVSRMGTERDKASSSYYGLPILDDAQLLNAYRGAWLPRKIVDIPAFDSVRAWRDWQADGDQIEKIEAEEKRLNLRGKVLEARIKARLWGGAAIHIGTGDQNLAEPLDVNRVGLGGIRHLTVLSRRQLSVGDIERDVESEFYGKPKTYNLAAGDKAMVSIHPSRLVIFTGNAHPDVDLAGGAEFGWGDSVLLSVMDAIKQADGTSANIASLVFEAKIDIIRVPDFMANLGDAAYRAKLLERYTLANTAKGINGTLILDKEEEYETKTTSFANLPDVLDRFLQIVSGAADIPATRLLGQSPAGMSATGESDLRNYYDRLSSMQKLEMEPAMQRLDEVLIRSALGTRPPEVHYIWSSLWQISDKERADIGKIDAETIKTLNDTGLFPQEALANAGANMLVEHSIMPGLQEAIDEAGGLPDYEAELEAERAAAAERLNAVSSDPRLANDAAPRTLYVSRKVLNGEEILRWAKAQGFTSTLAASDLHVTITYSRAPVDWFKMGASWDDDITVRAGGPRQMEAFGKAKVLLFANNMLVWRHNEMVELGASWDHPEYQPHITISYEASDIDLSKVEPYQGVIKLGPELFEEIVEDWAGAS